MFILKNKHVVTPHNSKMDKHSGKAALPFSLLPPSQWEFTHKGKICSEVIP